MDIKCVQCLRDGLKASGYDDADVARPAITITGGEHARVTAGAPSQGAER